MSIKETVTLGLAGEELSRRITGTSEVSAGRTAIATGAGAALGATAAGALAVGAGAVGATALAAAAAPVVVPVAVGAAVVSFFASLFD